MNLHYHLLINPAAGSGKAADIAQRIITIMEKQEFGYTTYYTTHQGHEVSIVEELAKETLLPWDASITETNEEFPLLLVLGGDGTLHQVVTCLQEINPAIPVSYIPAGSGNDFARGARLSLEPEKAFWHIFKQQVPRSLPVLSYQANVTNETGIAFNNIGIGLDAAIVETANQSAAKKRLNKFNMGSLSYIWAIFKVLFRQEGFPVLIEANGKEYAFEKAFLCTTTNHPYFGGGVAIAPQASIEDEGFDFVLVERIHLFKIIWLILLLTQKKHTHSKYFHQIHTNKLRIVSTVPQYCQTDGEIIGDRPYDLVITTQQQLFWL